MKRALKLLPIFTVAGLLTFNLAAASTLQVTDLPQAVQSTIKTEGNNGAVTQVQRLSHNGRTIYGVTFQNKGGSPKQIYLEEGGSYVTDAGPSTPLDINTPAVAATANNNASASTTQLAVNQLPEAVQKTINTELANGPVKNVTQLPRAGGNIYQVLFSNADGTEKVIYLSPDGTYVQDSNSNGSSTDTGATRQALTSTTKVSFYDVPKVVQDTLITVAGSAPVESIDKSTAGNGAMTIYQALFQQNGKPATLRVYENGMVVVDAQDQAILNQIQFSNPQALQWNGLPAWIQNGIRSQVGSQWPERIEKGSLNGKVVYRVAVRENGTLKQVMITENGYVLEGPVAAQ